MRKVEQKMREALESGANWKCGNTEVFEGSVYLFDNHIATYDGDTVFPNVHTLKNHATRTTRSRLRALGINVYAKNNHVYLNGELLCWARS